jgi:hypothetical protein
MLCFGIAKELGMTVSRLLHEATEEEITAWGVYFRILNDEQEKAMRKRR